MATHLQRDSSSSASSSTSSTDYCSTPPTDVSIHPAPHRIAPRALKLSKLPDGTTVKDLHRWFSPHGNLVNIEIYPQKNKDGLLGGCVAFHDPIYSPFWDQDGLHVQPPDSTVYPHGVNIGISPIQNDINSRDSQKLDVSVASFSATCLEFGSFKTDTELVIDSAVHASSSETLTLELLPFSRELVAHFSFPVNVRMGSRLRHYKFTAPLALLKVQYETDKNGDPAFLIISLPHPPTYSWRCDDTIWDMPQSARRWSPWKRATDICEDRNLPCQLPLRTYSEYDNISSIDIGRLTTFRFTLHDDADSNVEQLIDMLGILEDFNVTPVQCVIKTSCATTNTWNRLDYSQESANGMSSLSLANLSLTEDKFRLEFHVRYLLEVCISRNYLNEYAVGSEFLAKLAQTDTTIAARLLEYVIDKGLKLPKPLRLFDMDSSSPALHKKEMPHYCALVYKVHVTPTGLRPNPPNVELSNRVMRKYKHIADRFLRVQFLEETEMRHMAKTKDNKDEIWKRIERTFNRGIQIGDRLYEFLGFGSSQLKEGGVLFFCPTSHESCNDVRAWMGNFEHIKSIAKYGARLGQCLSTTREIRGMPAPIVRYIDDIERNGDCFTDGVGIISKFMSRLIIQDMAIDIVHEPSAVQFRMGGCKGVLTVWPQAKRTEVYIRQSQEKFRSSFNNLEVIRCSRYSTATLNRQTIAILECLGVPHWSFLRLLTEQINQYEAVLSCNDLAIHMLTKFVDENQSTLLLAELIHAGFRSESTLEPFVVNMLMLWRSWSLKLLKEKARIHVEKSAFVLGCVDETGTLRGHDKSTEGQTTKIRDKLPQIFLQYNDPRRNNKTIILRGICIVGRNPSLHPGDIRVVEAVDNPALHHLKDVVVFPSTGDRSVPGMLSGGDLDGDDYFVIWDDRLLPKEWNYPPMDYSAPAVSELERPVNLDDIKQFAIQYMKNDVLGLVAIAHLCWSDSEPDGPKSELCRELAALHSMAVDYQKTGIPAILEDHMQPRRWPHYMDKRNSYKSKKVLGKIYDKVMRSNISFSPDCSISFDKRILEKYNDLSQELLDTARQIKSMYDLAMKRLMAQRHIETEYELFSGWALSSPAVGTDYKRQEDLGQDMEALKSRFRDKCCEVVAGQDDEAMNRFVAAMYTVTAEQAMKAQNGDESEDLDLGYDGPPLISFPWIFDWVMVRLAVDGEYRPIRSTVRAARDKLFARGQTK